jgi:hypothetical protein
MCFSAYNLITTLSLLLCLAYHIIFHTCWVSTISILNLAKLMLRSWIRVVGVLRWVILEASDYPRSISCGIVVPFHCCILERFVLVFWRQYYCKSLYYVLLHWLFYIYFLFDMCENLFLGIHNMSIRFWFKNWVWRACLGVGYLWPRWQVRFAEY